MTLNKDKQKEPPSLFDDESLFSSAERETATARTGGDHGGLTGSGPLTEQLDSNFMQYAKYVIGSRAIPAVEDGLKPVQRRVLHALWEIDKGKFMKMPRAVGQAMIYHPHGEASIGPALVVLANKQWGKGRGFVIEGQGNFGNLYTGEGAAAPRYLECKLTKMSKDHVFNPKTTEYVLGYDGEHKEPVYLPCKLPLLLMMGAEGVAVGLSTSVLPHNFTELLEAEIAILRKRKFSLVPDFQLGGLMDASEYDDGLGKVRVRAIIDKEEKNRLVIRQLPWGETTDTIIESIRQAVEKKRLPIRNVQNLTAQNVEIVLTLAPDAKQDNVLEGLWAYTTCQKNLVSRPVVLKGGRPVLMRVSEILKDNVDRLVSLVRRELEILLGELDEEFHCKTLDQIFVEERIYKKIEEEESEESVEEAIRKGFKPFLKRIRRQGLTQDDIARLLELRIKRISRFDINRNRQELRRIEEREAETKRKLEGLTSYVIEYLKSIIKEYGKKYPRCTKIAGNAFKVADMREITANDLSVRYDRENHFVGISVRGGDELFRCSGLDKLVFVWKDGRYKMMSPPDRQFVDADLEYVAVFDKEKEFTCVYEEPLYGHAYVKRFSFGGMIQNKEYRLAPAKSKVLLFKEGCPERIYVKFRPAKNQRVHQSHFDPKETAVRGASAKGVQMTTKAIAKVAVLKPSWWNDAEGDVKGGLF